MTEIFFHPRLEKRASFFKVSDHTYGVAYFAGEIRLVDARTFTIGEIICEHRLLRADGFMIELREACHELS